MLCALSVASIRRGVVGRRLIAVRTNERAAAALGISVFGVKLYAFGVASAIAGLGGVLLAFRNTTVAYSDFVPLAVDPRRHVHGDRRHRLRARRALRLAARPGRLRHVAARRVLRRPEPVMARRDRRDHRDRPDRAPPGRRDQRQRRADPQAPPLVPRQARSAEGRGAAGAPGGAARGGRAGDARRQRRDGQVRRRHRGAGRLARGAPRRGRRADRPERRRQDDADRRDHGLRPPDDRRRAPQRRAALGDARLPPGARGRQPLLPAARALREQHRPREPDGRLRRLQPRPVHHGPRAADEPPARLDGDRGRPRSSSSSSTSTRASATSRTGAGASSRSRVRSPSRRRSCSSTSPRPGSARPRPRSSAPSCAGSRRSGASACS